MAEGKIFKTANKFRSDLLLRERAAASEMVRYYGGIWKELDRKIQQLVRSYYSDPERSATWVYQYDRLAGLRAQTEEQIRLFANYANASIRSEQLYLVEQAQIHSEQLIRLGLGTPPVGAGFTFNRLAVDALTDLVGFLHDGSPLRDLLNELVGDAGQAVADKMVQGLALGLNPRQVARNIRKELGNNLVRALRIARTEQLRAYRESTRRSFQSNSNVVNGWIWISDLSSRTCSACFALHGTKHSLDERLDDHPNGRCFPAGTIVSGPAPVAASVRYYTGQLVTIRTASGISLSFTPNHPILTVNGWIAGGLLKEGDYVIRSTRSENTAPTIDINDYQMPALIEDVAKSFGMVSDEMPTSAEDFHGDGKGSDVHVIRTNGLLRNYRYSSLFQPSSQQNLSSGLVRSPGLSGGSPSNFFFHCDRSSTGTFLRYLYAAAKNFYRSIFYHNPICFSVGTKWNIKRNQSTFYRRATDTQRTCNAVGRFFSKITVDNFLIWQRSFFPMNFTNLFTFLFVPFRWKLTNSKSRTFGGVADRDVVSIQNTLERFITNMQRFRNADKTFASQIALYSGFNPFRFWLGGFTTLCANSSTLFNNQPANCSGVHSHGCHDMCKAFACLVPLPNVARVSWSTASKHIGFSSSTERDASFRKSVLEGVEVDAHRFANGVEQFTGNIAEDRVVEIHQIDFTGHVYNLQTKAGWYTSNSIITHNCSMLPNTKTWEEIGFPGIKEFRNEIEDGVTAFGKLTEHQQLAILGPSKFIAFRNGAIKLPDLVGRKRSAKWGTMRYEKSLSDLGLDGNALLKKYRNDFQVNNPDAKINFKFKNTVALGISIDLKEYFQSSTPGRDNLLARNTNFVRQSYSHIARQHKGDIQWIENNSSELIRAITNPEFIESLPRLQEHGNYTIAHGIRISDQLKPYLVVVVSFPHSQANNTVVTCFRTEERLFFTNGLLKQRWITTKK